MKIIEAINIIDEMKPNGYTVSDKIRWLSRLDWMIKREVIDTHEGGEDVQFSGYDDNTPLETELLATPPYDQVYLRWMEAQIDYANGEYGRYNNSILMYNTAYTAYSNWYNRTKMPVGQSRRYF